LLDDSVLVISVGSDFVLMRWKTEEDDAADARFLCVTRHFNSVIDRQIVLARHRRDFETYLLARTDEDRINQRLG
jgi:hypothetical protein